MRALLNQIIKMSKNEDSEQDKFKLAHHPGLQSFMDLNQPVKYTKDAKSFYKTAEVLAMCNEIVLDQDLSEIALYNLLLQYEYELVDVGDLKMWITA